MYKRFLWKLQEVKEMSTNQNLPTQYTEKVIKEGWVGKAKGALQVLYKIGLMNPSCLNIYTADGKKDCRDLELLGDM